MDVPTVLHKNGHILAELQVVIFNGQNVMVICFVCANILSHQSQKK